MTRFGSIYKITNKITNKSYIGLTTKTVEKRWKGHLNKAIKEKKDQHICCAIRKYGQENFIIEELCSCFNRESLNKTEQILILQHNTLSPGGYNLTTGGYSYNISESTRKLRREMGRKNKGHRHSEESKKAMSKKAIERMKCPLKREISRNNLIKIKSNLNTPPHKMPHSKESKLKMSRKKLSGEIVAYKENAEIGRYLSVLDCSDYLNLNPASIRNVLCGRGKSLHGFTFRVIKRTDNASI